MYEMYRDWEKSVLAFLYFQWLSTRPVLVLTDSSVSMNLFFRLVCILMLPLKSNPWNSTEFLQITPILFLYNSLLISILYSFLRLYNLVYILVTTSLMIVSFLSSCFTIGIAFTLQNLQISTESFPYVVYFSVPAVGISLDYPEFCQLLKYIIILMIREIAPQNNLNCWPSRVYNLVFNYFVFKAFVCYHFQFSV